jgi:iron(III) transport system substrate-binding protein
MLSSEGQKALSESNMPAIRTDLGEGAYDIHAMTAMTGGELTPVKLDKDLLQYLDPARRAEFLHKWNTARGK